MIFIFVILFYFLKVLGLILRHGYLSCLKNLLCLQHCAGVNCLAVLKSPSDSCDYLFTGSRDGTLKRWSLGEDEASCSGTFESHIDWVIFQFSAFSCYCE